MAETHIIGSNTWRTIPGLEFPIPESLLKVPVPSGCAVRITRGLEGLGGGLMAHIVTSGPMDPTLSKYLRTLEGLGVVPVLR